MSTGSDGDEDEDFTPAEFAQFDRRPKRLIRWPEVSGVGYIGLFLFIIGLSGFLPWFMGIRAVEPPSSCAVPGCAAAVGIAAFLVFLLTWGWAVSAIGAVLFAFDMAVGWRER